jgi:hypothetical protein
MFTNLVFFILVTNCSYHTGTPLGPQYGAKQNSHHVKDDTVWPSMISSHNEMNDGAKKGDFLGQKKLILGHDVTKYGTNRVTFWDRRI